MLLRRVESAREREAIRRTRREIGGVWAWPRAWMVWVVFPVCGCVLVLVMLFAPVLIGRVLGAGGVAAFTLVTCLGLALLPVVCVWFSIRTEGFRRRSMWRALLWHGRCAACAQPLERGFDRGGLTRCGECGAAWALDRLRWGQCPECGYSLSGLARDERGEVTCPECGRGWWVAELPRRVRGDGLGSGDG